MGADHKHFEYAPSAKQLLAQAQDHRRKAPHAKKRRLEHIQIAEVLEAEAISMQWETTLTQSFPESAAAD